MIYGLLGIYWNWRACDFFPEGHPRRWEVTLSSCVQVHRDHFFRSMYNKTIIRFGFCDIHNNQSLGKGYSGYPKTLIQ